MWVGIESEERTRNERGKERGRGNISPHLNLMLHGKITLQTTSRVTYPKEVNSGVSTVNGCLFAYMQLSARSLECVFVCVCVVDTYTQPSQCMCACILTDGYCNDAGTNYWVSLCL